MAVATSHYRRLPPTPPHLEPATCIKQPAHKQVWFATQSSPGVEPGLLQHVREVEWLMRQELRAVLKALGEFAPGEVGDAAHVDVVLGVSTRGAAAPARSICG